jgi:hypothetical protein
MVVRTMCVECEAVTERAQAVCELCVPVGGDEPADEPFRAACLSTEYLRDQNKVRRATPHLLRLSPRSLTYYCVTTDNSHLFDHIDA